MTDATTTPTPTLPTMAEVLSSATVRYSPAVLDRALAAHDAQVAAKALRRWAAAMLDRYPEDVFVPPTRDDWDWVARLISQHGGVLDAFSAEIMRRAAYIAIKDAGDFDTEEPSDD